MTDDTRPLLDANADNLLEASIARLRSDERDIDRERMVELWQHWLAPRNTDFERGYWQGRFEEHADQNAIDPDDFPALRREAAERLKASS